MLRNHPLRNSKSSTYQKNVRLAPGLEKIPEKRLNNTKELNRYRSAYNPFKIPTKADFYRVKRKDTPSSQNRVKTKETEVSGFPTLITEEESSEFISRIPAISESHQAHHPAATVQRKRVKMPKTLPKHFTSHQGFFKHILPIEASKSRTAVSRDPSRDHRRQIRKNFRKRVKKGQNPKTGVSEYNNPLRFQTPEEKRRLRRVELKDMSVTLSSSIRQRRKPCEQEWKKIITLSDRRLIRVVRERKAKDLYYQKVKAKQQWMKKRRKQLKDGKLNYRRDERVMGDFLRLRNLSEEVRRQKLLRGVSPTGVNSVQFSGVKGEGNGDGEGSEVSRRSGSTTSTLFKTRKRNQRGQRLSKQIFYQRIRGRVKAWGADLDPKKTSRGRSLVKRASKTSQMAPRSQSTKIQKSVDFDQKERQKCYQILRLIKNNLDQDMGINKETDAIKVQLEDGQKLKIPKLVNSGPRGNYPNWKMVRSLKPNLGFYGRDGDDYLEVHQGKKDVGEHLRGNRGKSSDLRDEVVSLLKFTNLEEIKLGWRLRDRLVGYNDQVESVEKLEVWDEKRIETERLMRKKRELDMEMAERG